MYKCDPWGQVHCWKELQDNRSLLVADQMNIKVVGEDMKVVGEDMKAVN